MRNSVERKVVNRTIYYSAIHYKIEDETNIFRIVGDINVRARVEEIEFGTCEKFGRKESSESHHLLFCNSL